MKSLEGTTKNLKFEYNKANNKMLKGACINIEMTNKYEFWSLENMLQSLVWFLKQKAFEINYIITEITGNQRCIISWWIQEKCLPGMIIETRKT